MVVEPLAGIEELQAAILALPGVVGAVVAESAAGPPAVKVWTDDSRQPEDLEAELRSLVVRAHRGLRVDAGPPVVIREPDSAEVRDIASAGQQKRVGLGKGLDQLLPDAREEPAPGHLIALDLTNPVALEMIAIEESASGVTVRAVDTARNVAESKVMGGAASVNPSIVGAVAELLGETPSPRLVSVELRDTEVAAVLVVTIELGDGVVSAGAAVVQGGMPFTLGKATWAAIRSARS